MKKVLLVSMAFALSLFVSNKSEAQIKIGVFDEETVLSVMPGIQKVDTLLQKYVSDSLKTEYEFEIYQYQTKDSAFKRDSATMSPSLKIAMKQEIAKHFMAIQNWQQYQQQKIQVKQQEFLRPFLEKIYTALDLVIKEQKYTHVFKKEVFIVAEKSDELMLRVIQKMKIPVPKEIEEQIKALNGGGTTPTTGGGSKPATKPAGKN